MLRFVEHENLHKRTKHPDDDGDSARDTVAIPLHLLRAILSLRERAARVQSATLYVNIFSIRLLHAQRHAHKRTLQANRVSEAPNRTNRASPSVSKIDPDCLIVAR